MSGGVDSSVAAALLVEEGHEVVGVTMKTFCYSDVPGGGKTCCGLDGIADAKRVAVALDIPHYVFDVEEDFNRDVIDDFVAEYARGRTPAAGHWAATSSPRAIMCASQKGRAVRHCTVGETPTRIRATSYGDCRRRCCPNSSSLWAT
jgi:argininosuccinate synthase